jgi:hypothetical protein
MEQEKLDRENMDKSPSYGGSYYDSSDDKYPSGISVTTTARSRHGFPTGGSRHHRDHVFLDGTVDLGSGETYGVGKDPLTLRQIAGKTWKSSDAYSSVSSTISRDNTTGESARRANLLADFGQKRRPCVLGSTWARQNPEEPPSPEDEIVEVIEALSPVRGPSRRESKRTSGFRTVDPAEFGSGDRPMRKVSRR